ncbi:hypothetical protein RFI_16817 [Reticulomyxa filosa]|uniref:Uncharacterized protein n=1 Tax=Reticulomyxa filosa TaxID=46433 RepID=X6N3U3_RETFI|nr:hypothetical protein RFI_16817 [Reticulomyxa filosa]|eukprot:ETO20399.1 hypothetical protein RFI_16817 [Reticulomyxa filosa]
MTILKTDFIEEYKQNGTKQKHTQSCTFSNEKKKNRFSYHIQRVTTQNNKVNIEDRRAKKKKKKYQIRKNNKKNKKHCFFYLFLTVNLIFHFNSVVEGKCWCHRQSDGISTLFFVFFLAVTSLLFFPKKKKIKNKNKNRNKITENGTFTNPKKKMFDYISAIRLFSPPNED